MSIPLSDEDLLDIKSQAEGENTLILMAILYKHNNGNHSIAYSVDYAKNMFKENPLDDANITLRYIFHSYCFLYAEQ